MRNIAVVKVKQTKQNHKTDKVEKSQEMINQALTNTTMTLAKEEIFT